MLGALAEIKKTRKKHGLTQTQLSRLAGVSQSLIAKIEAGRIDPTYSKVRRLFDVLNGLEEKQQVKAADIATTKIVSVAATSRLSEAIKKMRQHDISQLPVIDGSAVSGLITESEIIDRIAQGQDVAKLAVEQVMEEAPPIVPQATPLTVVANLLRYAPIVVLSEKGKVRGVVTKADVLKGAR